MSWFKRKPFTADEMVKRTARGEAATREREYKTDVSIISAMIKERADEGRDCIAMQGFELHSHQQERLAKEFTNRGFRAVVERTHSYNAVALRISWESES